jgi:hypothetical protein
METDIPDEPLVAEYYEYRQQLDQMAADFREVITHPTYSLPFLQPGRLVKVKSQKVDFGWGVIINYQKRLHSKVCSPFFFWRRLLMFCRISPCRKFKNYPRTNSTSSMSC